MNGNTPYPFPKTPFTIFESRLMTTKLIPLNQQPDYIAAAGKLATYRERLAAADAERTRLGVELQLAQMRTPDTPDEIIAAADAAIAGVATANHAKRMADIEALTAALRKAIGVQTIELDGIRSARSMEAGAAMRARHIETVGPVLAAMRALADALKAEQAVRRELEQAGYGCTLPGMGFAPAQLDYQFDPSDVDNTFWRHWWAERENYIATGKTPAELDAAKHDTDNAARRAARVAKVTAPRQRIDDGPNVGELVG